MKKQIAALLLSFGILSSVTASNANAANKTLNVQVYMTTSETSLYGVSSAFLSRLPSAKSGI